METQATSNNVTSIAARNQTVCVADLDSILHRGYDKKSRRANPRGILKIREFAAALADRNVVKGTLCQNWSFGPIAEAIWKTCGLTCHGCNVNADDKVVAEATAYAKQPDVGRLILVSNDGDFCPLLRDLKHRGIVVEVWCRRSAASHELLRLAHSVRFIDDLLTMPREPSAMPRRQSAQRRAA